MKLSKQDKTDLIAFMEELNGSTARMRTADLVVLAVSLVGCTSQQKPAPEPKPVEVPRGSISGKALLHRQGAKSQTHRHQRRRRMREAQQERPLRQLDCCEQAMVRWRTSSSM